MSALHTPGPWSYRPHEHDDWGIVRMAGRDESGFQRVICKANYCASPSELIDHRLHKTDPAEADARLIAAAPELLDVLLDLFERDGVNLLLAGNPLACDYLEAKARAAIAKATGK